MSIDRNRDEVLAELRALIATPPAPVRPARGQTVDQADLIAEFEVYDPERDAANDRAEAIMAEEWATEARWDAFLERAYGDMTHYRTRLDR